MVARWPKARKLFAALLAMAAVVLLPVEAWGADWPDPAASPAPVVIVPDPAADPLPVDVGSSPIPVTVVPDPSAPPVEVIIVPDPSASAAVVTLSDEVVLAPGQVVGVELVNAQFLLFMFAAAVVMFLGSAWFVMTARGSRV